MSSRNAVLATILVLSLALSGPSVAFSGDYEGLKVSPVKKATTTTNGQRISKLSGVTYLKDIVKAQYSP